MAKKNIFVSVGEKSAENHAIPIVNELKDEFTFSALAGEGLADAGVKTLHSLSETSVLGFGEIIKQYPRLRKMQKGCFRFLEENKPDVLLLVDYPGFNIPLASFAKKLEIKTVYYIAPKTWAWGEWRLKKLRASVDKMAVIFPFEESYFRSHGIDALYVGNPNSSSLIHNNIDNKLSVDSNQLVKSAVLAILPGSRSQEIARILPPCIDAAKELIKLGKFNSVLVSKSDGIALSDIEKFLPDNRFKIINGSRDIYNKADFLIVKSGTSTLEAALAKKPFVAVYKVSPLSGFIIKKIIKIPNVTMANIMLNSAVVPEIMQERLTSENIVSEILGLLNDKTKMDNMLNKFDLLRTMCESDRPAEKVAKILRDITNG